MKKIVLLLVTVFLTSNLFAQNTQGQQRPQSQLPPPVPVRQVSGIVKDKTESTIPGAVVKLQSAKDTLSTSTNADGIFIFKNVKSATFVITISSLGYKTQARKMLNNDAVARLTLDPFVLESESKELKEVTINGTPSITYKVDTVEYRATDYKVRENAAVDELLKKMEGFEVGSDGSVTHQGQQITSAKLNGKTYAGGNLAQAIQNLPADIVEKIQVVDDYGDQAARTGIKEGEAQKVLNITTRADRSIGTNGQITAQAGNNDRYNARVSVQRINANQQLSINGQLNNSQNGVASSGITGGATNGGGGGSRSSSPGTTLFGSPSISYRDQWSKSVQVNSSYRYDFNKTNAYNNSYGQRVSLRGPTDFTQQSTSQNNNFGHNVDMELEYQIDSANFLQVRPSFGYDNSDNISSGFSDIINRYSYDTVRNISGYQHQFNNNASSSVSSSPTFRIGVLFTHNFKKPRRAFSLNMNASTGRNNGLNDRNNIYTYLDSATNNKIADSVAHIIARRNSNNSTYRASMTYSEPLSAISRLDFNGQTTITKQNSTALSDSIGATGVSYRQARLDNIFNTTAAESRGSLAFRFDNSKLSFGVGSQVVYRNLSGDKVNNSNGGGIVRSSRGDFKLIPVLRASYSWSRTQRLNFEYSGTNTVPSFLQIQDFTDRTDPNNLVTGNPNLKQQFTNSYNISYNNYFPNSRFNISVNANGTFVDDKISTNRLILPPQLIVRFNPITNQNDTTTRNVTQTTYINIGGSHAYVGRYQISKQLADRRYNIQLNGNITYNYNNAMSDNQLYHTTTWRFNQRFGPRINPTDNIEINPYIEYDLSRQFSNLRQANATNVKTTTLAIDGRFYFLKTYQVHYDARQRYVTGLQGLTNTSPLLVNMGFEKQFFARKQLTITFDIFDLLKQNNAIVQTLNENGGYTNTQSNALSRYFMFGARLRLQKWSGRPTRNGREMKRRGDGSFIYN